MDTYGEVIELRKDFEGRQCYIITNPIFKEGIVKIGRSNNPTNRIYTIGKNTNMPTEYQVLMIIEDQVKGSWSSVEIDLQDRFISKQVKTEGQGYGVEFFKLSHKDLTQIFVEYIPHMISFDKRFLPIYFRVFESCINDLFSDVLQIYNGERISIHDVYTAYLKAKNDKNGKTFQEIMTERMLPKSED